MQRSRTYYAFSFSWAEKIAHLSATVRLEIHEAAAHYAQSGNLPEMSTEAREAFEEYIMPDFRRRQKAAEYRRRAKERREAKAAEATHELESSEKPETEADPASAETETPIEQPQRTGNPKTIARRERRRRQRLAKARRKAEAAARLSALNPEVAQSK